MQPNLFIAIAPAAAQSARTGGIAGQDAADAEGNPPAMAFALLLQQGNVPARVPAMVGKTPLPGGKQLPDGGNGEGGAGCLMPGSNVGSAMSGANEAAETAVHSATTPAKDIGVIPAIVPDVASPLPDNFAALQTAAPATGERPQLRSTAQDGVAEGPERIVAQLAKPELPLIRLPVSNPPPVANTAAADGAIPQAGTMLAGETADVPTINLALRRERQTGAPDSQLPLPANIAASFPVGTFVTGDTTASSAPVTLAGAGQPALASTNGAPDADVSPRDFSALIDRLASSREAAAPLGGGPVRIALSHSEFGAVAIRFDQSGSNLAIGVSSPDPTFAPTMRAALAGDAAHSELAKDHARDQSRDQSRDQPRDQPNRAPGSSADQHAENAPHSHSHGRGNPHPHGASAAASSVSRAEGAADDAIDALHQPATRAAHRRGLYI